MKNLKISKEIICTFAVAILPTFVLGVVSLVSTNNIGQGGVGAQAAFVVGAVGTEDGVVHGDLIVSRQTVERFVHNDCRPAQRAATCR